MFLFWSALHGWANQASQVWPQKYHLKRSVIPERAIHRRSWSPLLIASFESLGPGLIILLLLFFFIFCFQVGRLQQEHHSRNCNFVAELKSISFIVTLLPTGGGGLFGPRH